MKNKVLIHEPYQKLKGLIRENGLTYDDLALVLGVAKSTISMKINGQSDFSLSEAKVIQQHYKVGPEIFLN